MFMFCIPRILCCFVISDAQIELFTARVGINLSSGLSSSKSNQFILVPINCTEVVNLVKSIRYRVNKLLQQCSRTHGQPEHRMPPQPLTDAMIRATWT